MTRLESVRETVLNHNVQSLKKRHLYLAYLALHMENPGLHPDDYLYDGSGYAGWMVLLVEATLTTGTGYFPDNFHYPCAFLKIEDTLTELHLFHEDLESDDPAEDTKLLAMVNTLQYFFEDMKGSELDEAVDSLQKLYLYHACESDTEEEEAEKPAGILKECADVLTWIQQFSN